MIEKFKALPLKSKIFYITFAVVFLAIITLAILWITKVITIGALCMFAVGGLTLISLANLQNGSIKEEKSIFVFNLIVSIFVFACFVAIVVMACIQPDIVWGAQK